jgi:hypothetical protein
LYKNFYFFFKNNILLIGTNINEIYNILSTSNFIKEYDIILILIFIIYILNSLRKKGYLLDILYFLERFSELYLNIPSFVSNYINKFYNKNNKIKKNFIDNKIDN